MQERFGYAYDAAWNLNTRTNNALIQSFGVNDLNELTSASRSGTLTVAGQTTLPGSSLASVSVSGTGLSSGNADVYSDGSWARTNATLANGTNTYTATATDTTYPTARTATNSVGVYLPASPSYTYDGNGNLVSDGTRHFEYDDENQLTNVCVTNAWKSEFVYDGLMRRRIKKEYAWQGGAWVETNEVRYVYDQRVVIQERNGNNLPQVTYTWGLDLSGPEAPILGQENDGFQDAGGIGGLLARTDMGEWLAGDPNATAFYHSDANGNVTCLVNTNGFMVASYKYDPYGNVIGMGGSLAEANKYRFSSKEWDGNAGLYYYGFRFYDPHLQRWPNRDPFEEPGFEVMQRGAPYRTHPFIRTPAELIEGPNLYYFVGNNPMFYGDPFGLSFCSDFGNGLNNTVSGIGESLGQGLYDLSHWQWSQDQYERIADKMYSMNTPDNPAATPYVEGALGVSAAAAASAAALGSLEAAGIIDTAPQGNNVIRVVCKPLKQGLRLDKPHHGKWYHWHWWKW